jgi:MFS family permease
VIVATGVLGFIGTLSFLPLYHWEGAFVGSILYWMGTAALPVMSAHVAATTTRDAMGRSMGLVYGGFFVGFIFGAPLSGVLGADLGLRAPIVAAAALFALSTTATLLLDPGRRGTILAPGSLPRSFWALLVLAPVAAFVEVLPTPLLPVYLRDVARTPLASVGLFVAFLSVGSALFSTVAGRISDRVGPVSAIIANAVLLTVGAMLAALTTGSLVVVAFAMLLLGANVASNPVLAATLERILPARRLALGYSAFQLAYGMGFGLGGIAAGALYETDPFLPLLATAGLALPISAAVAVIVVRIVRSAAPLPSG